MTKLKPFVANKILQKSLDLFYLYDKALTNVKPKSSREQTKIIEERAYTHRLAVYLELLLRKYKLIDCSISVDCEYSNFIYGPKSTIEFDHDNGSSNRCYPDIIVHKRFNKDINLIVIEAKKAIDYYLKNNGDGSRKIKKDLSKLKSFANKYQFAYFVLFGKDSAEFYQVTKDISDQEINKLETKIKRFGSQHKISA